MANYTCALWRSARNKVHRILIYIREKPEIKPYSCKIIIKLTQLLNFIFIYISFTPYIQTNVPTYLYDECAMRISSLISYFFKLRCAPRLNDYQLMVWWLSSGLRRTLCRCKSIGTYGNEAAKTRQTHCEITFFKSMTWPILLLWLLIIHVCDHNIIL